MLRLSLLVSVLLVANADAEPPAAARHWDPTLAPLRAIIERYAVDRASLRRFDDAPRSQAALDRAKHFHQSWQQALQQVDFAQLDQDGRVDYLLLRNQLRFALQDIEHRRARYAQIKPLVEFAEPIIALHEDRRAGVAIDAAAAAQRLDDLLKATEEARDHVKAALPEDETAEREDWLRPIVANRAARHIDSLLRSLRRWHDFYSGYDPEFSWWTKAPYGEARGELESYAKLLREKVVGIKPDDEDPVIGDPVGAEMLQQMLANEMIPYTPQELIEIAEQEFEWCRQQRLAATRDLGFGDNWKAALNHTKNQYVPAGQQPELIHRLADEAVEFLEERDLLTIPPLCKTTWRMEMMSPARQKVSPYFLGGETIIVSYPTDEMSHADKMMSMRGNNPHFSKATVHHELIPGHHLQGYMTDRYRTHRQLFRTPFWVEGWALYWEMRLWDMDFHESPEDRMGMLFWRSHRCARIIFSLSFHLEQMTAQECIDFLVDNVGHERNNATAEVRRSVRGDYPPLYQAAYMLGGLQIRALHGELVKSGKLTERAFHDAILQQNAIPIELIRAAMTDQQLQRDAAAAWRFYD